MNEVKRTKAELAFQKMQEKMVRFLHKLLLSSSSPLLLLLHSWPSSSAYQVCQNVVLVCTATVNIVCRFEEIIALIVRAN